MPSAPTDARRPLGPRPALLALALGSVALAGCGDGRPAPQATASTSTSADRASVPATVDLAAVTFVDATDEVAVDVVARDNEFVAPFVEVRAGTTVRFANEGSNHDVTPAAPGSFAAIAADDFGRGEVAEVTFTRPGDYVYYCSIHGTPRKGMVGAVRVVG